MDILGAHVLVVHSYHVSVISTNISLLVLILIRQGLQIGTLWIIVLEIWIIRIISDVTTSTSLVAMNTWQLFRMLFSGTLIATAGIHRQWLIKVAHILWRSEILKDILHILVICAGIWGSSGQSSLIVHTTAVSSFDAHISKITRRNQIKTKFTRFNEFHVAYSLSATHLLFTRHNRMTVDTPGIRFSVMVWIHTTMSIVVALMMHITCHDLSLAPF